MSYALRSRSMVRHLTDWLKQKEPKKDKERGELLRQHPRVKNLAGLLRRNGLLQTVLFLQSKGKGEGEGAFKEALLWQLLEAQLGHGAPFQVELRAERLAALKTQQYLFLNERAIEIAVLLSRLVDAEGALRGPADPEGGA